VEISSSLQTALLKFWIKRAILKGLIGNQCWFDPSASSIAGKLSLKIRSMKLRMEREKCPIISETLINSANINEFILHLGRVTTNKARM
jgi:hypothetical protein